MASLTIRKLDDTVKAKLRVQAARKGHSMEEEARAILSSAVERSGEVQDLFSRVRRHVDAVGGFDLKLRPRGPVRRPPTFD